MISKKIKSIIAISLITMSFIGCNNSTKINTDLLSDKEKTEIISKGNTLKLEQHLLKNISEQSEEDCTKNVKYLLSCMENTSLKINSELEVFSTDLKDIPSDITDYNSEKFLKNCPSNAVRGIFQDAIDNHMIIKKDNQGFYVVSDFNYVIKTYGSKIQRELKEMLEFESKTDDNIFNEETQSLDFKLIAEKINQCEKNVKKYKGDKDNNDLYLNWLKFEYFYYSTLLNPSDDIFFDNTTSKYKDSVIKQYEDLIKTENGSQLGKDVQGYLDIIKANDNKTNNLSDEYLNKLNEKFIEVSSTPVPIENKKESSKSTNTKENTNTSEITPKITIIQ